MAATMTFDTQVGIINLTGIDADWDYEASKPSGWPRFPAWHSIQFHSDTSQDVLVVRHGSAGGVLITRLELAAADGKADQRVYYCEGKNLSPYIDEEFLGSSEIVILTLWRDQERQRD